MSLQARSCFAPQQLGLCRDDIQEIDRTLRVTLTGGLQGCLISSHGDQSDSQHRQRLKPVPRNRGAFPRFSMFAGIRSAAVRRRTLKREERGASFFLHREMRRLA